MRRVLLTGGAGFIGSHTAEALLARGDRVVVLDNFDPYYPAQIKRENIRLASASPNYTLIEGSICDGDLVRQIVSEHTPEIVIHLAAKAGVRPSVEDPLAYMEANVRGTVQLLECLKDCPLQKIVFASSSSVYGAVNKVPFSESDPVTGPLSPYAASKIAGESICHSYHHIYDLPIVCLRFFTVYGPRQRPDLAINKFVRLISEGKPIPMYGDGSSERDYTFVSDIVRAILLAAESSLPWEVMNIGGSSPITLRVLIDAIAEATGSAVEIERLPDQPGDMPRTSADITKAQHLLGWSPAVSLPTGLREFVKWRNASQ